MHPIIRKYTPSLCARLTKKIREKKLCLFACDSGNRRQRKFLRLLMSHDKASRSIHNKRAERLLILKPYAAPLYIPQSQTDRL